MAFRHIPFLTTLKTNIMNTELNTNIAGIYAPPTCNVINLELDGAILSASGASGSFELPVEDNGFIELN